MIIKKIIKNSDFALFLLVCLSIITLTHSLAASAKFQSTSNSTTGAKVAKWSVSIEPVTASNVLNIVTGSTAQDYIVKVKSLSEVSSAYSLIVSNVPNDVTVSLDDGTAQTPVNNTVTFSNAGSFSVGGGSNERQHKLTFNAPLNASATNVVVNIQANFTQKD